MVNDMSPYHEMPDTQSNGIIHYIISFMCFIYVFYVFYICILIFLGIN